MRELLLGQGWSRSSLGKFKMVDNGVYGWEVVNIVRFKQMSSLFSYNVKCYYEI